MERYLIIAFFTSTYRETIPTRDPSYPSRAQEGYFSRDGKIAGVVEGGAKGKYFSGITEARPAGARTKPSGETR